MFYFSLYIQWLFKSGDIRISKRNNGTIYPRQKTTVVCDVYGGIKLSSSLCEKYYESTQGMVHISKGARAKIFSIKNHCGWYVDV